LNISVFKIKILIMKLYDHSFQKQGMDTEKHPNCPSSFIFHQIKKTLPDNNNFKI